MSTRFTEQKGNEWTVLDVRDMKFFNNGDFDVAVDKFTHDAMITGSLWDSLENVTRDVRGSIIEVSDKHVLRSLCSILKICFPSAKEWWRIYLHHLQTASFYGKFFSKRWHLES